MTEPSGTRPGHASVAGHFVRLVTDHAARRGLPATRLLAATGLQAFALDDNEARLPFTRFVQLCDTAAGLLDDSCLGLHAGEDVRPGHLGSHGFALMSCTTVQELLERSLRYSRLVIDACHNEFEIADGLCVRYWRSNLPGKAPAGRTQDELNMVLWISLARWVSGRPDLNPSWVAFQHTQPSDADLAEYQRLFRCPLRFAAADTAIAFPAALLDLSLPQANLPVRQMLDTLCERLLRQLANQDEPAWLARCREAMIRAFERGTPDAPAIAAHTGLDEATLRQGLAERGTSFRALVEDLRRELALEHIRNPDLSLIDIAYLLGFSEQSAFQRAFKRWTSTTPGEYRRQLAGKTRL